MENNISTPDSTPKRSSPLGQIKIHRRFYSKKDPLYFAWKYVENHQTSLGDVPSAVLEVFRHFYAPFGMQECGNHEEVMQSAIRSISFLEGHLRYLKALYEAAQNAQTSAIGSQNHFLISDTKNGNGHSNGFSQEDLEAVEAYRMLDN